MLTDGYNRLLNQLFHLKPSRTQTKQKERGTLSHLLQRGPLTEHQRHCDALQGRLGVEVEEQQLAQGLGRPDLLGGRIELRVADTPTQSGQQSASGGT